jgi:hypothetical protein
MEACSQQDHRPLHVTLAPLLIIVLYILGRAWLSAPGSEQGRDALSFLKVTDGSCLCKLQVIVHAAVDLLTWLTVAGTLVLIESELRHPLVGARKAFAPRGEGD